MRLAASSGLPLLLVVAGIQFAAGSALGVADRAHDRAAVTPVQKVIQLLGEMKIKGTKQKQVEEVEFSKFQEWCEQVRDTRQKSIREGSNQITQLEASTQKAKSDAEALAAEIADLEASIDKAKSEAKAAAGVRVKEEKDYLVQQADLTDSIDAVARALQVLKSRTADTPQSLVQLTNSRVVPATAKAAIASYLSEREGLKLGAPEANAYEFQSGGVISLLEKLGKDFKDQLLSVQKTEVTAKANFEALLQQLTNDIEVDTKAVSAKTKVKASRLEDAASGEGDLEAAKTTKAEDEKALSKSKTECQRRTDEFDKNQVTRAEEIKTITEAVQILSSSSVSGNAEKYLPSLSQVRSARVLAQLQTSRSDLVLQRRLAELLRARSEQLGSQYLAVLASRANADPLAKVKQMIKDLLLKLSEEATTEADEHGFCSTELATNRKTREDKGEEVDSLSAQVDQLTSEIATLTSEIEELNDAIAELQGQRAEATKNRNEEKATNMQTVADAKEAQMAVQRATVVLRDFYDKAGSSSLLQSTQGASLQHEMSEAVHQPYQGQTSSSTGILGKLEVILNDFARLEAETSAAEESAASDYGKFMDESEESIKVKETAVDHKTSKRRLAEEQVLSVKKELELTHQELNRALDYYDKLRAQCVGTTDQDRKRLREQEIQALKEAIEILTE